MEEKKKVRDAVKTSHARKVYTSLATKCMPYGRGSGVNVLKT